MAEKISSKVYEKIKNEDIRMKPCGYFKARSGMWMAFTGTFFLLSVIFSSLAFYYFFHIKPFTLVFQRPVLVLFGLPYFYIMLVISFLFLTAWAYRKSRNMCRHEEWLLLTFIIFGSFLIGYSVYIANVGKSMRVAMEQNEAYSKVVMTPKYFWSRPKSGTLSGVVMSQDSKDYVLLKSWDGKKWRIIIFDENPKYSEMMQTKNAVKMIGQELESSGFLVWRTWNWN